MAPRYPARARGVPRAQARGRRPPPPGVSPPPNPGP
ncbi:UNVERIFIED_ORG: hypothetical protein ABIC77_004207, partial [Stenotrophomonas geniculata]